jgi:hypothetical protein
MKKKIQFFLAPFLTLIFSAGHALAFSLPAGGGPGQTSLNDFVNYLLNTYIYPVLSVFALGSLVWGGVILITSGGDEAKVTKGKKILTYSVAGILLLILSYAIIRWTAYIINL